MRAARCGKKVDEALTAAIKAVRALELPHLERLDASTDGHSVH
jgi:hypothetical protein